MLAYFVPSRRSLTRRALLVGTAALAGCARHKSRGFPGYAFVANAGARTVAAVDLNAFALAKQISLDSAPGAVLSNPLRPGVYVLMPESGAVCEIDATKLAVVRTTRWGNPAVAMRLAADGKSLWGLQARARPAVWPSATRAGGGRRCGCPCRWNPRIAASIPMAARCSSPVREWMRW